MQEATDTPVSASQPCRLRFSALLRPETSPVADDPTPRPGKQSGRFGRPVGILLVCLLTLLIALSGARGLQATERTRTGDTNQASETPERRWYESFVTKKMENYLGVPYRRGGKSIRGMDCSGFAKHVYSKIFGIELPHQAAQQYALPGMKKVARDELKTGDLLFFANKRRRIDHVGIYLADGKFIHSASRKGVSISALEDRYWRSRFVGSKRSCELEDPEGGEVMGTESSVELLLTPKSSLHFQFASLIEEQESDPFVTYDLIRPSLSRKQADPFRNQMFTFKLGYNRALWNDRWNLRLSALWGKACQDDFLGGTWTGSATPWPSFLGIGDSDTVYRSGLELASDIDLTNWLRLTPSVAYFGYDEEDQIGFSPRGILGLEANLVSPLESYALSMSFHYVHPENADYLWAPTLSNRDSLGMSFAFRYRLADMMRLSLTGQHSLFDGFLTARRGSPLADSAYHDLFFTLDFSY